jgi:putative transposase
MPNRGRLLLWSQHEGELAIFMQRLTITHVRRWQQHRGYAGLGHIHQSRYQSFTMESDECFWVAARYVERNALRAQLVLRAEEWRWSGLWRQVHGTAEERSVLTTWPIARPPDWVDRVNRTDERARAGVAPPKCAPRAHIWSAGPAKADHETIGPRVGLSSQWSTAEDGP